MVAYYESETKKSQQKASSVNHLSNWNTTSNIDIKKERYLIL